MIFSKSGQKQCFPHKIIDCLLELNFYQSNTRFL